MVDEADTELFIEKIKTYPPIWDLNSPEYSDRQKKRNAWVEVCREFYEGFEEEEDKEKNEICNKFIRKWRNIRDSYMRNVRKKTKSGQAADVGRHYVYARQLSFLKQSAVSTETQSSLDASKEREREEGSDNQAKIQSPKKYRGNVRKRRANEVETSLLKFMNTPIPTPSAPTATETNPDRSFFESLLPALSQFTEDQKIDFRCEVLRLLKNMRYQNITPSQSYQPHAYPSNLIPQSPYYPVVPMTPQPFSNSSAQAPHSFSYSRIETNHPEQTQCNPLSIRSGSGKDATLSHHMSSYTSISPSSNPISPANQSSKSTEYPDSYNSSEQDDELNILQVV